MNYYNLACSIKDEAIRHRRYFHQNAEVGLHLPKTKQYVIETLVRYGISPSSCGNGVTARIGTGQPVILLRADMDALPMSEESGLAFACPTGEQAHCCGHDLHAAMLLTAAKLLKENESALSGTVKLMFQTAEETFEGALDMIQNGILTAPKPDAALAFHVASGKTVPGTYFYNDTENAVLFSMDGFTITIQGHGAHGAFPHLSIDPINIGVHIHLALQELISRECNSQNACLVTVGQFSAGSAPNIIPETAVMRGTIRSNNAQARELLVRRVREVAERTATVYGGTATVEMSGGVPPLLCDPQLTEEMVRYLQELSIPDWTGLSGFSASASEDFSYIASKIPSTYIHLSAGFEDERGDASAHNPKVQFNEDVLPIGAACMAHCVTEWLKAHR